MELGIKPGREMGILLDEMLELVLENPELNNDKYLKGYAKEKLL
jgi:tRNA nucleotidyltransferase (CCA-adding enzyme)